MLSRPRKPGFRPRPSARNRISRAACSGAQHRSRQVLGPILQGLMQQRGANMILDKNAVVFANTAAFDITQPAIDQLNQKMSSLKVTLGARRRRRAK